MNFDQLNKKINDNFIKGNFKESLKDLIQIYKQKKTSEISNKIGVILTKLNKKKFAENFFVKSTKENDNNFKPFFNLANLFKNTEVELSEKYIDQALSIEAKPEAKILKSHLLINKFKYIEAIKLLNNLNTAESNYLLGISYLAIGDDDKGKHHLNETAKFSNCNINFINLNTFPRVYKNTRDIKYFRNKFEKLIDKINFSIKKNEISREEKQNIIKSKTNFNLAYQQKNDKFLNKKYFNLLNNFFSKNYPQNKKYVSNKILFVSGFFYKHTVSKLFFNFVKEFSNIKKLNINLLYISEKEDNWTQEYKELDVNFYKILNTTKIYNFLKNENFGSIFFLDHAMNNISQFIINTKLAKNYFIFWGHPITTGSINMDYFISSSLMDKGNDDHYSEKLILLNGIGFNYKVDENLKKIENCEIKKNSIYIPQGIFKFLPKYDYLYGEILAQNENLTISFIKDKDPYYTNKFKNRLKKVKSIKKNFDRLIFIEGMSQSAYYKELNKYKLILDTIGWSGGNTTMEALYLNKPIITLRGNNLRANHTAAILGQLDLDILIAKDYKEYLYLVKKIMIDKDFYELITNKISKNKLSIFNNNISLYEGVKNFL